MSSEFCGISEHRKNLNSVFEIKKKNFFIILSVLSSKIAWKKSEIEAEFRSIVIFFSKNFQKDYGSPEDQLYLFSKLFREKKLLILSDVLCKSKRSSRRHGPFIRHFSVPFLLFLLLVFSDVHPFIPFILSSFSRPKLVIFRFVRSFGNRTALGTRARRGGILECRRKFFLGKIWLLGYLWRSWAVIEIFIE